jgi:hypothetical protein
VAGIVFIVLAGSALHFVFEWTDYWQPIGWLAAVNESVWEHFKLAFWPGLFFGLVEYATIRKRTNNFWVGKSLGLLAMPIIIGVLYYGTKALIAPPGLVPNILFFVLAAVAGQAISYRILTAPKMGSAARWTAMVLLVAMVAAFALFSYFPPHVGLFQDPPTGGYGILEAYGEH